MPLVQGPFERLPLAQKYTVLEETARALLLPTDACPPLTAVNESAIYYVYAWLTEQFDECESGEEVWGQEILDVLQEISAHEEEAEVDEGEDGEGVPSCRPSIGCMDFGKWKGAIETIADKILWDRDFEMGHHFAAGRNPGLRAMRIDRDYFTPYTGGAVRGAKGRLYDLVGLVSEEFRRPQREAQAPPQGEPAGGGRKRARVE